MQGEIAASRGGLQATLLYTQTSGPLKNRHARALADEARGVVSVAYSKRRAGLLQKISFLGCAGSIEYTIPVWKAAEAGNDLMMTARRLGKGPFVRVFRQSGIEAHSRLLIGEALAMLERQVKEAASNRRNRTIIASGHGLTGGSKRCRVFGVSPRRIAE